MPATRWTALSLGLGLALTGFMTDGVATAQSEAKAGRDFEAARRHYQAAEQAAAAGNHAVAAAEYGIAYDITKDPVLFFKIGQAHDRAGDCPTALVYYDRFLKEAKPAPEHRQRTRALMAGCKTRRAPAGQAAAGPDAHPGAGPETGSETAATGAIVAGPETDPTRNSITGGAAGPDIGPDAAREPGAAIEATPRSGSGPETGSAANPTTGAGTGPGAPATSTGPVSAAGATEGGPAGAPGSLDREQPTWQRTAAWTSIGVALALGTTAIVLGLSAGSREEDVQNLIEFRDTEGMPSPYTGATRDRYEDLIREGSQLERLSIGAAAATGAVVAASVVFFLLDHGRVVPDRDRAVGTGLAPTVGPSRTGLTWSGSF